MKSASVIVGLGCRLRFRACRKLYAARLRRNCGRLLRRIGSMAGAFVTARVAQPLAAKAAVMNCRRVVMIRSPGSVWVPPIVAQVAVEFNIDGCRAATS